MAIDVDTSITGSRVKAVLELGRRSGDDNSRGLMFAPASRRAASNRQNGPTLIATAESDPMSLRTVHPILGFGALALMLIFA